MSELIVRENVYISDASSKEDLFKELYDKLKADDLVNDKFLQMVYEREKNYPTGMDMSLVKDSLPNIAIPHTEAEACNVTRVIPVKLNKKISFNNMIDPEQELDVSFIFMILNGEGGMQTDVLAKIMDFVTKTQGIEEIFSLDSEVKIYEFIEKNF